MTIGKVINFSFLWLLYCALITANDSILATYAEIFEKLPGWDMHIATIQPYGNGCTNLNYKLKVGDQAYFVRTSSPAKEMLGLSLAQEMAMIELATRLELCPPVVRADFDKGILIFKFIEGSQVNLREKDQLKRAVQLFKTLHEAADTVPFLSTPEAIISQYLKVISSLDIKLTPRQQELIANRPRPAIDTLVPCHLDFKGDNIIDDGTRLWLIDWEYGGMSDTLMDIGQLAPSEGFSDDELSTTLSYYAGDAASAYKERLLQFKTLSNLRIALWCMIMARISTLDHPYQQWVEELFHEIDLALPI